ncbi:hypothetical protein [Streptomyces olivochromogenes]|uniref:hypothetical protein n=1 Tax=Streptomyces olivochromogenes TaxID=1963 RepID=UPI00368F3FDA
MHASALLHKSLTLRGKSFGRGQSEAHAERLATGVAAAKLIASRYKRDPRNHARRQHRRDRSAVGRQQLHQQVYSTVYQPTCDHTGDISAVA